MCNLPPLNIVASQIIHQLGDEYISLPDLVEIIEQDPATTARLLGLANSAMYQLPSPVLSLHEAVVQVLGLDITRAVSLGIAFSAMLSNRECDPTHQRTIWFDSLLMANCTREVVSKLPEHHEHAAHAYTGALLSNLGILALASKYPKRIDKCFSAMHPENDSDDRPQLLTTDHRLQNEFGFNHRQIAAELAQEWGLPNQLLPLLTLQSDSGSPPYDELAKYAGHNRVLVDNYLREMEPLPERNINEFSSELQNAFRGLSQRLDRLAMESERAATAITAAS